MCAQLCELLPTWWNRWGQGVTNSNDHRSEGGDSCSLFPLQLQRASTFTCGLWRGCICPLFTPSPHSMLTLTLSFFFSHCLFFCPRLNSLTHCSESTPPPPPPPPWQGCHGDHRVQSWLGGLCLSVCVFVCYSALGKSGRRSELVTCLLITHTWGRGCTLPHISVIYSPSQESFDIPWAVVSIYWYVCVHVPRQYSEHWRWCRGRQTSRPSQQNSVVSSRISPAHR